MQKWCKSLEKSQKSGMVQRKKCRSRQELSNEYLLAKIGVDTAENEPPEGLKTDCLKAPDGDMTRLKLRTPESPFVGPEGILC